MDDLEVAPLSETSTCHHGAWCLSLWSADLDTDHHAAGGTMCSWPSRWTMLDGPSAHHVCTNGALGVGVAGLLGWRLRGSDQNSTVHCASRGAALARRDLTPGIRDGRGHDVVQGKLGISQSLANVPCPPLDNKSQDIYLFRNDRSP